MPVHHLPVLLRRAASLNLLATLGRTAAWAATFLVGFAVAASVLDAMLALSLTGRQAVTALGGVAVAASFCVLVASIRGCSRSDRGAARQVEERFGWHDNRLINAIDLDAHPSKASSPVLAATAIHKGESTAAEMSSLSAVDFRPMLKGILLLGVSVCAVLVFWMSAPGLFAAVAPRYWDPSGDHPPYTLLSFDIEASPRPALYRKPVEIQVSISGPERVGAAELVLVEGAGRHVREKQRLAMIAVGEGRFSLPLSQMDESFEFYVDTRGGRSRRERIEVAPSPRIEEATTSLEYPRYTGWSRSQQALGGKTWRCLTGTTMQIAVRADRPLSEGRWLFTPDTTGGAPVVVPLHPDADNAFVVQGETTATTSGRYSISVTGANGAESLQPVSGRVNVTEDQPPRVSLAQPTSPLLVAEDYTVPVAVQATDDVGIDRMELRATINGFGPTAVELLPERIGPQVAVGRTTFDLKALGAQAGDVITVRAIAWDRFPPHGQFAETELAVIRVLSKTEYQEQALAEYSMDELVRELDELRDDLDQLKKQQSAERDELDTLQKRLKETAPPSDSEKKEWQALQERLQKLAEKTRREANQLNERAGQPALHDAENEMLEKLKSLAEELEKRADSLDDVADELQRLLKTPDDEERKRQLEEAIEQLKKQRSSDSNEEQEQLHQEMNRLRDIDHLRQQGEKLQDLVEKQRDLADRIGEFRNRDSLPPEEQARAERMAGEQDRLKQELKGSAKELKESAEKCESTAPRTAGDARKLADELEKLKVDEDQTTAADSARRGDGRRSHEAAESAAKKLESLAEGEGEEGGEKVAGRLAGSDTGLRLSKQKITQTLKALSLSRQLPALTGLDSLRPDGEKPGSNPNRKGGEGSGRQGSRSRATVMGPHQPREGNSKSKQGQNGRQGLDERSSELVGDGVEAAEALTPENAGKGRGSGGLLRGVPAAFRDQAEAYFRRISEGK